MNYTAKPLRTALDRVLMSHGGVEALFSRHRIWRDGLDAATFARRWPRLSLTKRVGIIACIMGPCHGGDIGMICRAHYDLCTRQALRFS